MVLAGTSEKKAESLEGRADIWCNLGKEKRKWGGGQGGKEGGA